MTDINIGAITEALNDKSDRDLRNVDNTAGADAVIEYQLPTAQNNYTWYRKYKSGWIEQGGILPGTSSSSNIIVYLPIEMADANYSHTIGFSYDATTNPTWEAVSIWNKTTTSFNIRQSSNIGKCWEVKGMAAS
ncbi:MAG: hypothetical protein II453_09045 [Alphaproteobacteria bacterium]|nr:hypothetical protein [Alphaproteobacteria bacterium]